MLSNLYPEYEWLPWKFAQCPQNFWENVNNQLMYVNWAGKQFQIKEMSDWYNVTLEVFKCICLNI